MLHHHLSHALRIKVFEEVYDTLDNDNLILLHNILQVHEHSPSTKI